MKMQTEKLFDTNPYDTEFTAQVVGAENGEVVLDRTLFFPEEGGQTCDKGYLEYGGKQFEVEAVRIEDEVIYHRIDTDELKAGDKVTGHIDWAHRFDNMQNHTGEHIFSGIVHSMKGYDNVGFSLTETTCQMDYNGKLTDKEIAEVEEKAKIWRR